MSKHNNFQQNMLVWNSRQRNRSSVFLLVFISFLLSFNAYMLKLGGKDVLNERFPLSCVFGTDFEQICIAEIEILCVKSLVFHASINVKLYDFYLCQYVFFAILEKILSLIAV